jgi:hypothetical protein
MTIGGSVKFGDILDRLYEAGKEIRTSSIYPSSDYNFHGANIEKRLDFVPALAWWERHSGVV